MQQREDDPTHRTASARVGTRLREKWRIDALLGVGGMAAVYAATHRNGKRVAIKILHPEIATNIDVLRRFLHEGYVANRVEHPGAIAVLDDDVTDDGAPFLVMELVEGETLDARQNRAGGRLPVDEALLAIEQLLDVLASAHARGIIHRDVKPDNVLWTNEASAPPSGRGSGNPWRIKVLDFGIAHLREMSQGTRFTRAGHAMGTSSFMPPEQARGRWDEVDPRSDVWAVGATLFTLLTGRHVHEAETSNEVLLGAMTMKAPALALLRPDLPEAVLTLVDRALAFDKNDRWPSAEAMRSATRAAAAGAAAAMADRANRAEASTISATNADENARRDPASSPSALTAARTPENAGVAVVVSKAPNASVTANPTTRTAPEFVEPIGHDAPSWRRKAIVGVALVTAAAAATVTALLVRIPHESATTIDAAGLAPLTSSGEPTRDPPSLTATTGDAAIDPSSTGIPADAIDRRLVLPAVPESPEPRTSPAVLTAADHAATKAISPASPSRHAGVHPLLTTRSPAQPLAPSPPRAAASVEATPSSPTTAEPNARNPLERRH